MISKTKQELIEFLQRDDIEIICVDWDDMDDEWPATVTLQYAVDEQCS